MKKRTTAFISVILIVLAIFIIIGTIKGKADQTVDFDDIEYVRPDIVTMRADVDSALEKLSSGVSEKKFEPYLDTVYDEYLSFNTMYALAEIRYYLDVTDDYFANEYAYCCGVETDVLTMFDELYIACAKSDIGAELEENYFWEGFAEEYGTDYTGYTDEEFAALSRQEAELLRQYRELIASATVTYRGEEIAYEDVMYLEDITVEEYAAAQDEYYDKYYAPLAELYIRLVEVRQNQAAHFGYESFADYAFDYLFGRDYLPEDAGRFVDGVKEYLVPVYRDATVALYDKELYFNLSATLNEKYIRNAMFRMSEVTDGIYEDIADHGYYDITVSSKKADISFQSYLNLYDMPFALVKTYGYSDDLFAFAHEFGHCLDAYYNYNGTESLELQETFSQGLELLILYYFGSDVMLDNLTMATEQKLYDALATYCQQASFYDFERQVYALSQDELTPEKLKEISLQTAIDYGYFEEGYEEYYSESWVDILHFFEQPYYVISYCTSLDAAMQLYELETETAGAGVDAYIAMLPRDNSDFLTTITEQGGLVSPFDESRMPANAALFREKLCA